MALIYIMRDVMCDVISVYSHQGNNNVTTAWHLLHLSRAETDQHVFAFKVIDARQQQFFSTSQVCVAKCTLFV